MIIPPYGTATYRQLAAILRDDILNKRIRPGYPLPSETMLQQTYGVARLTVRRAVDALRAEGLADYKRGRGVMVREQPERSDLHLPAGATLISRMPTLEERDELDVAEGVPVFAVTMADGAVEVFPADRWQVRLPSQG